MADIIHRIGIRFPAAHVFKALSTKHGLAHWWTEEVDGEERIGGKLKFTFRSVMGKVLGVIVMEIKEISSQTKIRWKCIDGPPEWIGTDITFELSQQNDQTILLFGHRNWKEAVDFTAHCSMKWAVFLLSLRDYVETGKGKPAPRDMKIDNWN